MRLIELQVEAFGALNNLRLGREELAKNITVIYGLNEAGKSTLMEFILGVLFGFNVKNGGGEFPLRGGRLVFRADDGGLYQIERVPRGRKGRVTVTLPDGTSGDEARLKEEILHGVTPLVYRNVFAFGVDEMRRLEELGASEISAHVYGAGAGIRAGRLTYGLNRLQDELNLLFRPGGAKPEINRLLKELEGLEAAVRLLQKEPERYEALRCEATGLREQRTVLEERKRASELRGGRLERALQARESWICLQDARRQLESLPSVPTFPDSGVERLSDLENRIRDLALSLEEGERKAAALEERLAKIEVDGGLLERTSEIRALDGERSLHLERLRRLPELSGEALYAGEEYQKQLQKLGLREETLLETLDTSLAARAAAEEYRLEFVRREARLQEANTALSVALKEMEERARSFQDAGRELAAHRAPHPPSGRPLSERERALDALDTGSRRLTALRGRMDQLRDHLQELQRQKEDAEREIGAPQPRFLPRWLVVLLVPLLAAFAVPVFSVGTVQGLAALLAGCMVMALVLLAGKRADGAAGERRRRVEEAAGELDRRIEQTARQIDLSSEQEAALAEELKGAAGIALGKPGFLEEEIPAARRSLEVEKRALAREEDQKQAALKAEEALKSARLKRAVCEDATAGAKEALYERREAWRSWLAQRGLPQGLSADGALAYFDAVEEARKRRDTWRRAGTLENEVRCQSEAYLGALNSLLSGLGRSAVPMHSACDTVIRLGEALGEAVARLEECLRLEEKLGKQRQQGQSLERAINALREEVSGLLAEGGAAEAGEFLRRAQVYLERKKALEEIRTCERDLRIVAGSPRELAVLEKDLAENEDSDLRHELKHLAGTVEDLEKEVRDLGERIGGLENHLRGMESGEELAEKLQEKELKMAALQNKAREWQARALCLRLLGLARERHERERQPAVLLRASRYLGPMTEGRYTRAIAPVGRTDLLEVETPGSVRVAASSLSRGAASQLYLSVRLALARQYASAGLPVILDDILVDFDPGRLRGAIRVLAEFGQERQVFLLTCHDHILEALGEGLGDFGLVRLHNGEKISVS